MLSCLEENGLSEKTIVIFTSDNGGMFNLGGQTAFKAGHRQNGDLLGFKFGVWEGGHRVPFLVRWPGKIAAGTESSQLIGHVDLFATFAAVTGQQLTKTQLADSVNLLSALTGEPEQPIRDHLILAPHQATHLSVRKGKWMYIPARGSGGFTGKNPGEHTFAGPPAVSFVGAANSDIEDGRIRKDAPPAQLYDLEADPKQMQNLHHKYPDKVKELSLLLESYRLQPAKRPGHKAQASNPAIKVSATSTSTGTAFDFESGNLEPWRVVEGKFGHLIGSRENFFHNNGEYNKQGKYYLTTLEPSSGAQRGMDTQTGVIVSPLFIPKSGEMTFRIGGGHHRSTYVALCTADGKEVAFARGINSQVMQNRKWDLSPHLGQKLFIKVVDKSTSGWGHITVDDFQFDAEVLSEYPKALKTK